MDPVRGKLILVQLRCHRSLVSDGTINYGGDAAGKIRKRRGQNALPPANRHGVTETLRHFNWTHGGEGDADISISSCKSEIKYA